MRKLLLIVFLSVVTTAVTAQQVITTEQYRYYKLFEDEDDIEPLQGELSDDVQVDVSQAVTPRRRSIFDYSSIVINYRRGVGYYQQGEWFEGLKMPKINYSRARKLSFTSTPLDELSATHYTLDTTVTERTEVGINIATRNYLAGATASTVRRLGRWRLCCDMALRTGRDSHIQGVFTNEATVNLSVAGAIDDKSYLFAALLFTPSERGGRKASFAEAFALTSNNYYNPAWGYQGSKVRNANTTTSLLPTAVAAYKRKIGHSRTLAVALSATLGSRAYSTIDWLGGATPLPDNYRYLPSYYTDPVTAEVVSNAWQNGDSRYTQINFDELHRRNALQDQAIYILNDRVTRVTRIQLSAAMSRQITEPLTVKYGVYADFDRQRNFKRVADLLSGRETEDIDYFLIDDDAHRNMLINNTLTPNRRVGVSDRYGYDYALTTTRYALFTAAEYTTSLLKIDAYAKVGSTNIVRRGYFCKELFASNSYGQSKRLSFADWAARIAVRYTPNPLHTLAASVSAVMTPPEGQNLFLQTEYNNRTINNPTLSALVAASLGYSFTMSNFGLQTTLFTRYYARQTDVMHSFYDAAAEYADIVTTDLASLAIGFEAEAHYDITDHWTVAAGVTAARYRFAGSPMVTVYADRDNSLLSQDCIERVDNLRIGTTPEFTAVGSVRYFNRGWGANITGQYHAQRYVLPSLVRRTESILSHTTTPEQRVALTTQERLPNAFSLDLTLSKSIYLKSRKIYANSAAPHFTERHPKSKITIFLAVNNIIGSDKIIFRGYESSRIRKKQQWDDFTATPFATYYLYAYPRTYFLQVKFSF